MRLLLLLLPILTVFFLGCESWFHWDLEPQKEDLHLEILAPPADTTVAGYLPLEVVLQGESPSYACYIDENRVYGQYFGSELRCIPLADFPDGPYQLLICAEDFETDQHINKSVNFTLEYDCAPGQSAALRVSLDYYWQLHPYDGFVCGEPVFTIGFEEDGVYRSVSSEPFPPNCELRYPLSAEFEFANSSRYLAVVIHVEEMLDGKYRTIDSSPEASSSDYRIELCTLGDLNHSLELGGYMDEVEGEVDCLLRFRLQAVYE